MKGILKCFQILQILTLNNLNDILIQKTIQEHLENLRINFEKYILPDLEYGEMKWIENPFEVAYENYKHLNLYEQEELIDISADLFLKSQLATLGLNTFWLNNKSIYPNISKLQFILFSLLPQHTHVRLPF